jgi:hypothetical protein
MKNNISKNTKKTYQTPVLKKIGSVRKLTLKAGSQVDAFGGTFTP